jgi:hypothetical protein
LRLLKIVEKGGLGGASMCPMSKEGITLECVQCPKRGLYLFKRKKVLGAGIALKSRIKIVSGGGRC